MNGIVYSILWCKSMWLDMTKFEPFKWLLAKLLNIDYQENSHLCLMFGWISSLAIYNELLVKDQNVVLSKYRRQQLCT